MQTPSMGFGARSLNALAIDFPKQAPPQAIESNSLFSCDVTKMLEGDEKKSD